MSWLLSQVIFRPVRTKPPEKPIEIIAKDYTPQCGDFRIVPQMSNTCAVEEYRWLDSRGGIWTHCMMFTSEQDAENYISKRLEDRAEVNASMEKLKEFKKTNPPRTVPPYKFLTEKPKESL